MALPNGTPDERTIRDQAKRAAYREGARVQHEVLQRCVETARLASGLSHWGLASARGDAATGLHLARAGARSAEASVRGNLAGEDDDASRGTIAAAGALLAEVEAL